MTRSVSSEKAVNVNLIEGVYLKLTEAQSLKGCTTANKRAIRKRAQKFVMRHGVLFLRRRKAEE